jgi:hypothetical protein
MAGKDMEESDMDDLESQMRPDREDVQSTQELCSKYEFIWYGGRLDYFFPFLCFDFESTSSSNLKN